MSGVIDRREPTPAEQSAYLLGLSLHRLICAGELYDIHWDDESRLEGLNGIGMILRAMINLPPYVEIQMNREALKDSEAAFKMRSPSEDNAERFNCAIATMLGREPSDLPAGAQFAETLRCRSPFRFVPKRLYCGVLNHRDKFFFELGWRVGELIYPENVAELVFKWTPAAGESNPGVPSDDFDLQRIGPGELDVPPEWSIIPNQLAQGLGLGNIDLTQLDLSTRVSRLAAVEMISNLLQARTPFALPAGVTGEAKSEMDSRLQSDKVQIDPFATGKSTSAVEDSEEFEVHGRWRIYRDRCLQFADNERSKEITRDKDLEIIQTLIKAGRAGRTARQIRELVWSDDDVENSAFNQAIRRSRTSLLNIPGVRTAFGGGVNENPIVINRELHKNNRYTLADVLR